MTDDAGHDGPFVDKPFELTAATRSSVSRFRDGTTLAEDLLPLLDAYLDYVNDHLVNRHVAGYCPNCGNASLELALGGDLECVDPGCFGEQAAHLILQDHEIHHIVRIEQDRFHVQHPLRERIGDGLLHCGLHLRLSEQQPGTVESGVYRVDYTPGEEITFEAVR